MNKRPAELAATLSDSKTMDEFSLEASSECEGKQGLR